MPHKIAITSTCFADLSNCALFTESCKKNNVIPHILMEGNNLNDLISFVEKIDAEYILHTDSFDVIMNRWDEIEVLARLRDSHILFATESNCYPNSNWSSHFEPITSWPYPNGGQYLGKKERIIDLWKEMMSGKWLIEYGGGTQEQIQRMFMAERIGYRLDYFCNIFQSMCGNSSAIIIKEWEKKYKIYNLAYNLETESFPMFLHFNGRTQGIEEWFKKLYD